MNEETYAQLTEAAHKEREAVSREQENNNVAAIKALSRNLASVEEARIRILHRLDTAEQEARKFRTACIEADQTTIDQGQQIKSLTQANYEKAQDIVRLEGGRLDLIKQIERLTEERDSAVEKAHSYLPMEITLEKTVRQLKRLEIEHDETLTVSANQRTTINRHVRELGESNDLISRYRRSVEAMENNARNQAKNIAKYRREIKTLKAAKGAK